MAARSTGLNLHLKPYGTDTGSVNQGGVVLDRVLTATA